MIISNSSNSARSKTKKRKTRLLRVTWLTKLHHKCHFKRIGKNQLRVQDFPDGTPAPEGSANILFDHFFSKNHMKMNKFGLDQRREGHVSAPLPDENGHSFNFVWQISSKYPSSSDKNK